MIPKAWMRQIEETRELKNWNLQENESEPSFLKAMLGAVILFVVIAGMIILLFSLGG